MPLARLLRNLEGRTLPDGLLVRYLMNREKLQDWGLLLMRLAVAMVLTFHGAQKVFGAFGGRGMEETANRWGQNNQFPQWLSLLGMITEFAAAIALGLGLLSRVAALGLTCVMAVAVYTHVQGGDPWNKIEFPLALALISLGFVLSGSGKISLDYLLFGRKKKGK